MDWVKNRLSDNGLSENGPSENGLSENGQSENGQSEHGLRENGLSENQNILHHLDQAMAQLVDPMPSENWRGNP